MASQMSGSVAFVCPRYCGRNPYNTTFPFPTGASTSAALPCSRSAPNNHPDARALPVDSYVATALAFDASVISKAGESSNQTAAVVAVWRAAMGWTCRA